MKAQDRIVKDWLTSIRSRRLGLPRFQRYEAWNDSIINSFWTSLIRGLPVGVSLILEVAGEPPFKYRFISGAPTSGESVKELLLDGQQRLTSLWRALTDDYDERTYLVGIETEEGLVFDLLGFDMKEHGSRLFVEGESRWIREKRKFPLWVDDPANCLSKGRLPLRILNPDNSKEYREWCKAAAQNDQTTEIKLITIVGELRNRVENFNIPYLYLPAETEKSVAIDVFIKLNTSYAKLSIFDIIVAQVEEETDTSLHDLLNNLRAEVPEIEDYIEPDRYTLSVAALLQDKLPSEQGYLSLSLPQLVKDWSRITHGTRELVELLEADRIYDSSRLPTETILAPLAALLADVPTDPDERGNLRLLLRKYMWRSFFTARYDRAIATRILPDYRQLKKVILKPDLESSVPIFDESEFPLPPLEELLQAGWPKNRDRLARAILLLSFSGGAFDFADASQISRKNIISREYHHLYPVALLEEGGKNKKEIYCALNCALITWKTNRKISRKDPVAYLLDRAEASSLGEDEIRRRLFSHLVDYNAMRAGHYEHFLMVRGKETHRVMVELCGKIAGGVGKQLFPEIFTAENSKVPKHGRQKNGGTPMGNDGLVGGEVAYLVDTREKVKDESELQIVLNLYDFANKNVNPAIFPIGGIPRAEFKINYQDAKDGYLPLFRLKNGKIKFGFFDKQISKGEVKRLSDLFIKHLSGLLAIKKCYEEIRGEIDRGERKESGGFQGKNFSMSEVFPKKDSLETFKSAILDFKKEIQRAL